MNADGYALFDTAIGWCGVAWRAARVVGVQLPEGDEQAGRVRLRRNFPNASELDPPAIVRVAIYGMVELIAGRDSDLCGIELDMSGVPPFQRAVYEFARTIPTGETVTYGAIAAAIDAPESARAVGRALGANPFPIVVPCHRVVAAAGGTGGFSARGGVATKLRLLAIERSHTAAADTLFDLLPDGERC